MIAAPLLFLDVDGTLLPYGPTRYFDDPSADNPLLGKLNPAHGQRLLTLGCELVWATTWEGLANEEIGPRIGLPPLPVVEFPDTEADADLHWKTPTLITYSAGRPFAWLDDEIGPADQRWVDTHQQAPALLRGVDPITGLTDSDFAAVREWVNGA